MYESVPVQPNELEGMNLLKTTHCAVVFSAALRYQPCP